MVHCEICGKYTLKDKDCEGKRFLSRHYSHWYCWICLFDINTIVEMAVRIAMTRV